MKLTNIQHLVDDHVMHYLLEIRVSLYVFEYSYK